MEIPIRAGSESLCRSAAAYPEEQGEDEKALESFSVAILFDHEKLTPEAMYHAIRIHQKANESAEAQTLKTELLERYPSPNGQGNCEAIPLDELLDDS